MFFPGDFTFPVRQIRKISLHVSLLCLGFVLVHILVLLLDRVEPLRLMEVVVPFVSSYRPLWTGVGIITFYLSILVTVTFYTPLGHKIRLFTLQEAQFVAGVLYVRKRISLKTFRKIHYLSIVAFFGALPHGLYAGADSALE